MPEASHYQEAVSWLSPLGWPRGFSCRIGADGQRVQHRAALRAPGTAPWCGAGWGLLVPAARAGLCPVGVASTRPPVPEGCCDKQLMVQVAKPARPLPSTSVRPWFHPVALLHGARSPRSRGQMFFLKGERKGL